MPRHQHQQTYDYSCGATALLCAAMELGLDQFPANSTWGGTPSPLRADTRCESAIFAKVGKGGDGTALKDRGYATPDRMVRAAHALELTDVDVYLPKSLTSNVLTLFYPGATDDAERALGDDVRRTEMPKVRDDQRVIKVLRTMGVGLHWVMARPDGSFMDPADGRNYTNFAEMNQGMKKWYSDTGLAMVIGRD